MLSKFSVKKPFTIVVAIIIIAILGVVSYLNMTTDLLPNMNLPYAVISTAYVGASPEEVEDVVTKGIEQSMSSISNIKNITSTSSENHSMVMLEFNNDVNIDTAIIEIREKLDMLSTSFPTDVATSTIMKLNPSMMPIMSVAVSMKDKTKSESSSFISDKIIPEIESVDGVATVSPMGLTKNLVNIQIDLSKVEALNKKLGEMLAAEMAAEMATGVPPMLPQTGGNITTNPDAPDLTIPQLPTTFFTITNEMLEGILKGQNFSMPTGNLSEDNISYLVKTGDKIKSVDELRNLTLISLPYAGYENIKLSDVATITELDTASESYSKVNGEVGVLLTLSKQADFSTAEIAKSAKIKFAALEKEYTNIKFSTLMDQGDYVNVIVEAIFKNIIVGALLAALILLLFLKSFRSTFVIAMSILVSVVTAVVFMYFSGITLNIISMGGLALGVGMLVDNSIVVIENIYRMRNEGKSAMVAAIEGAKQVSGAIFASTLTTVIVFVPILFTQGFTRQIFTDLGLTISFSLIASLLVALTLVPMASATVLSKKPIKVNRTFERLRRAYEKVLNSTLNRKWVVFVVTIALLGGSLFTATTLGTELLPESDMGNFTATIKFPNEATDQEIYDSLDKTSALITSQPDVLTVGAIYGGDSGQSMMNTGGSNNSATLYILLKTDRAGTTNQVAQLIRDETKGENFELSVNTDGADLSALTGGQVVVDVFSRELADLNNAAISVAETIANVQGVINVDNGIGKQSDELRITVNKEKAMKNGLTVAQVFTEANSLLQKGGVATTITQDGVNYDIYVDRDGSSATISDLENIMIKAPTGVLVKLSDIATVTKEKGFVGINRENGERKVSITASLADGYNVGDVNKEIEKALVDAGNIPNVTIKQVGQNSMMASTFNDLYLMLGLAIVFIYLVMVAQFQSLLSPFIVMFTIPLAFTGGFFAQFITGTPISAVSLIGLVLLVGIVVNNGIVFVDYTNQLVEGGKPVREALLKAGRDRLRPILLTALTTVFAQVALCFDTGSAASMTQAMAITSIGGLVYATVLTLFLVPALYELFHTKRKKKASNQTATKPYLKKMGS